MANITEKVDEAKWGVNHWKLFLSLSLGYFMWGLITSIAPLTFSLAKGNPIYLALPAVYPLIGTLLLPYLSDRKLGRKKTFYVTLSLYTIGAIVVSFTAYYISSSSSVFIPLVLAGLLLANIGVEGEVPTGLSYTAENFPLKWREKLLVLVPNFDNVGGTVAAFLAIIAYSIIGSSTFVMEVLGISAITVGLVLALVRLSLPESVRWLMSKGEIEEANKNAELLTTKGEDKVQIRNVNVNKIPLIHRYLFLVAIGVSQYLTFGLMAYAIADYYFPNSFYDSVIIFVASLATSLAGLIATYIVSKVKSRSYVLTSFLGGTLTMFPILALVTIAKSITGVYLLVFYALLSLNMLFSEFAWGARTILEPLLFPTENRAFFIGLVRAVPIVAYSVSLYLTENISIIDYVVYNIVLWAIGALASFWWYYKGYDTNLVPLEETAIENLSQQG
ncbi:MFS transporter [Stygiolobus caldivivus]|uniref:MFS transporter n=1 Tax=Stygiolobus caldivivus TaxID=2824673 RepID=A0A8D5ZHB7_9CREN|nr:MFS transporter [Stygiolobus caldivivus]BCU69554.1 MFS transporter [Stygiolobus caldivivus]